jgi:ATP-dependent exoDNAse (exonuclease V) beta subunit
MATTEQIPTTSVRAPGRLAEIARVTGRSRYYAVDGERLPSVTSILGAVWPKPALYGWYAKRGRESLAEYLAPRVGETLTAEMLAEAVAEAKTRPQAEADEAADLGSQAHDLISRELTNEPVSVPASLKMVMGAFRAWQNEERLVLVDAEVAVYHKGDPRSQPYAGTIDALFRRADGSLLLVDWKTSNGTYPDHLVQAEGYRQALIWLMAEFDQRIDAQVVRLGKSEPTFEVTEVPNLAGAWDAALAFYAAYKAKGGGKRGG